MKDSTDPCAFYGIPKLHKMTEGGPLKLRPISAAHSYITAGFSIFLGDILQKEVMNQPQILRDSKHLISMLENLSGIPQTCLLMVADVESLYPNIPINDAIRDIIRDFYQETCLDSNGNVDFGPLHRTELYKAYAKDYHGPIDMHVKTGVRRALTNLLHLVLDNHVVEHGGKIFRQIQGTAMGTNTGPPFANLYMASHEAPLLKEYHDQIILYVRFIDDLFVIWNGSDDALRCFVEKFNSKHPNIKITAEISGSEVHFLDLTIYKGERFYREGRLDIKPYSKPMNKYLYLPVDSNHPKDCKHGFIKGNLIRLICNSSDEKAFVNETRFFFERLKERGYTSDYLSHAYNSVSYTLRNKYLEGKQATPDEKKIVLPLILPFNPVFQTVSFTETLEGVIQELLSSEQIPLGTEAVCNFLREETQIVQAFRSSGNLQKALVRAKFTI